MRLEPAVHAPYVLGVPRLDPDPIFSGRSPCLSTTEDLSMATAHEIRDLIGAMLAKDLPES